ncbi:transcriptional regulator, Crp/Fnr family [Melioribacter roseus P3M-2]|uniref:Transcriptional regulator, Crp/Fnr family n=1 Tax=Melioribacter roseus (strain DSM 23840 / JCM 17771 / VKM B-2668 / P3M-2) TaxID=1191523 RepID=I6ZY24_MELRP|nr:response regulator [Melioribacter roseus]AFN73908.1 transcriptional regulator, Crp/Fnr family [Melioribacter roseus P3M-2]
MKKVLIIEDNKDLAENIVLLLKEFGYETFCAYNGSDGLKTLFKVQPDIILCDIMLPDLSGYKILSSIKKIDDIEPPVFIFLTAKGERVDVRKGMELGADDYIPKPFTYTELLNSIKAQLDKRNKFLKLPGRIIDNGEESGELLTMKDYIFINDRKHPGFYKVQDIACIISMKDYTKVYIGDGRTFLMRKSMKDWEAQLPQNKFVRIHRQTIVNIDFVESLRKSSSNRYTIKLKGGDKEFDVSQRSVKKIKLFSV